MCNIAAYVGTRPAAPILIEMIRRQEGFAGGYYTGLATVFEGRLHSAKKTGDLERLLQHTDAASLPGTVGIIHSRSDSGGVDSWAHPFLGGHGEDEIAYVANGAAGPFRARMREFGALADSLLDGGYTYTSIENFENPNYQRLSNGMSVHMSDVMCQLILKHLDEGRGEAAAMAAAFEEMPGDVVGLLLARRVPDSVFWSRINRPMMMARAPHGVYLATTAWAFPDDAGEAVAIPPNTAGRVTAEGMTVLPYAHPPIDVPPITAQQREQATEAVRAALLTGEKTVQELKRAVSPLFPDGGCSQCVMLTYEALCAVAGALPVKQRTAYVVSAQTGLTAPKFYLSL